MNVRQIVLAHLKAGGFDGLAGEDCGCGLDDLMPCDGYRSDCHPAKAVPCDQTCRNCVPAENIGGVCYRKADQPANEEETHL